jgi:tape measure domain-containing protein
MSIAQLGYEIDSSQAVEAERNLDKMGAAADKAGGQAEGLKRETQKLGQESDKTTALLRKMAGVLATAFSVRSIAQAADTWTDLTSRVQLAIGANENARDVMSQIETMARRTYSSLQQTTEGWIANATALRELGMTTQQSLLFQEAMNNALVVSGARADRAASVQNALSQAMALGVLRGDQLNTVIMNGGRLAELLAQEMGVTVTQLRSLGSEGKITGDVIQSALLDNLELLREEADSMPATIGDALTLVGNSFLGLVGKIDEVTGSSARIAEIIIVVADNLDLAVAGVAALAAAVSVQYVSGVVAAAVATNGWIGSLVALKGALISTGIGAFVVLAGVGIGYLFRLRDATGSWGEVFGLVYDLAKEAFDKIKDAGALLVTRLQISFNDMQYRWTEVLGAMMISWGRFVDSVAGSSVGGLLGLTGGAEAAAAGAVSNILNSLTDQMVSLRNRSDELTTSLSSPLQSWQAIKDVLSETADETDVNAERMVNAVNSINTALGGTGRGGSGEEEDTGLLSRFQALQDELRTQAEQVEIWYVEAQEALQWALENERLTLEEHAQMKLQIEQLYQEQLAAIRAQAANQNLSAYGDLMGGLAAIAQAGGDRMTRIARIFGAAQALINTYVGASEALKLPFPANLAAAAKVIAAGMGFISAIRGSSTSGGGGGGSVSTSSAPTGASGVTQSQTPLRRTIVELRGPDWVKGIVQPVMEQIYQASEDGQVVFAR